MGCKSITIFCATVIWQKKKDHSGLCSIKLRKLRNPKIFLFYFLLFRNVLYKRLYVTEKKKKRSNKDTNVNLTKIRYPFCYRYRLICPLEKKK